LDRALFWRWSDPMGSNLLRSRQLVIADANFLAFFALSPESYMRHARPLL
jgi:hypothetical protein